MKSYLSLVSEYAKVHKKKNQLTVVCITISVMLVTAVFGFFGLLITSNWGQLWQPPLTLLTIIISAAILTTFIAVISPAKKLERMSIVNVVNAG